MRKTRKKDKNHVARKKRSYLESVEAVLKKAESLWRERFVKRAGLCRQ